MVSNLDPSHYEFFEIVHLRAVNFGRDEMGNSISSLFRSIFGSGPKKPSGENLSQREKDNISEMSKYDNLLEGFEKLVSIWEENPRKFEADTSTTLIQQ